MGTVGIRRKSRRLHLYIAEWREERGKMSQETLGSRLDPPVGKNTVSRWETQQHRLDPQKIADIAHALDLEPEELWRPPPTRSVDAILKDVPIDLKNTIVEMALQLKKTGVR